MNQTILGVSDINLTLVLDLDGTILKGDILIESINTYLSQKPWGLFQIFKWVFKGKAHLKEQLL